MGTPTRYSKPALNFNDQLAELKGRGMIVGDEAQAIHWLKTISYYRLSAYFHPFKESDDTCGPGTDFERVQMLYSFDRKLRLLLLDAIERIEVALRAAIAECLPEVRQLRCDREAPPFLAATDRGLPGHPCDARSATADHSAHRASTR